MAEKVVRIGSVDVSFPEKCVGSDSRNTCPEIVTLQRMTESLDEPFKRGVEELAVVLGTSACANCPGVLFTESESKTAWVKRCRTTGRIVGN